MLLIVFPFDRRNRIFDNLNKLDIGALWMDEKTTFMTTC